MNKISAVYKITNTITGDFYIGSSKNVKHRWAAHKCPSTWNKCKNNPLYLDMKKYGLDKFSFQILEQVEIASLKEAEQRFIEILKPVYNSNRADGWDIKRYKETIRNYQKSDKGKESHKKSQNKYNKSDKCKKSKRKYNNQLCFYYGETITLNALTKRFWSEGISNPTAKAKKYLLGGCND